MGLASLIIFNTALYAPAMVLILVSMPTLSLLNGRNFFKISSDAAHVSFWQVLVEEECMISNNNSSNLNLSKNLSYSEISEVLL